MGGDVMIQLDKSAHILAGAVVALALGYLVPWWFALLMAIIAGALKEWYWDLRGHGTVDVWDFAATCGGGFIASLFVWIIK